MEKKQMKNKNGISGITLIALVVTVVILIILASITVRILIRGGIISGTGQQRELYENKTATEQKKLDRLVNEYKEATMVPDKQSGGDDQEEPVPGLYARDGSLIYSWQKLIEGGYITDNDNIVDGNMGDLEGRLVIRNGVTEIVEDAFNRASKIYEFDIPSTVTKIGQDAFLYTFNLEAITVASDNPNFKSVDGVLFTKSMKTLLQYPEKKPGTTYTIPNGVVAIGKLAFGGNEVLEEVTIGGSVRYIRDSAFKDFNGVGYSKVKKVIIGERC